MTEEDSGVVVEYLRTDFEPWVAVRDVSFALGFGGFGLGAGVAVTTEYAGLVFCDAGPFATPPPGCTEFASGMSDVAIGAMLLGGVLFIGSMGLQAYTERDKS